MKESVANDNRPAWIGLDVAKRTFDAAVHPAWQPGQGIPFSDMPKQSFPRTVKGVVQLLAWLDAMGWKSKSVRSWSRRGGTRWSWQRG